MEKRVKVYFELPSDTVIEQIYEDYSGRVISTTVEANLNLGELNIIMSEIEAGLKEFCWGERNHE